uniref:Deoxyribonuclease n=1 Tax=Oncorhynchus tshawytscha TaxID=74940 RepID=A0AAZ3NY73_ONCTS
IIFISTLHILPLQNYHSSCLLLGAFNIKTFGDKKSSNSTLMDIITQIVHRYDIVLIQEVRDTDLSATNKLMQHVNKGLSPYRYPLPVQCNNWACTGTYTERYLYLYREETVSVAKNYTYDDGCEPCGTDTFIREPFIEFCFDSSTHVLIPQHTSPDLAVKEVDALYDVAADTPIHLYTHTHWLIPDHADTTVSNTDCPYDRSETPIHLYTHTHWLIPDHADTTVSNTDCPYDRVVATTEMMRGVVPGSAEVFNYMTHLKLSHSMVTTLNL